MASLERRLLCAVLNGTEEQQKDFLRARLPESAFRNCDDEWRFVLDHLDQYGIFPERGVLRERFKDFEWVKAKQPIRVYVDLLRERETYTRIVRGIDSARADLTSGRRGAVYKAMERIRAALDDAEVPGFDTDFGANGENRLEGYAKRRDNKQLRGIPTPYKPLNSAMLGLQPGNLTVLVGRMYTGKSWLAMHFAAHAWNLGYRVLFISKEMSSEEVELRLDALTCRIDYSRLLRGRLSSKQFSRYQKMVKAADRSSLVISDEDGGNDIGSVRAKIMEHKPDFVIVDGAYLLNGGARDLVQSAVHLSRGLKRLARTCRVPILVTGQANRQAEGGKGNLATIAWSDSWAQDGDHVFEISGDRAHQFRLFTAHKIRNSHPLEFVVKFQMSPRVDLSHAESFVPPEEEKNGTARM